MRNRHKPLPILLIAAILVLIAGLGSYALAQSGDDTQPAAAAGDQVSRHVDYNVTLQVNGDLSAVDPKLAGILPLNLSASGGADVSKSDSGPAVNGNLQVTGLDTIIQKVAAENGAAGAQATLGAGMVQSALSDLQFTVVDNVMYVKLAGTWYNTGDMSKHHDLKPEGDTDNAEADTDNACAEGAFAGGPKVLLKDVRTVGQEDIDGTGTTHYQATVDLDKAITEAAAAATNCGKTDEAAKLEAARGQLTGAVKQLNLEWWLDTNNQLRQAKAEVAIEPATLAPLLAGIDSGRPGATPGSQDATKKAEEMAKADAALKGIQSISLNATVKFSHFGEDFQIAKPEGDTKPLSDLTGKTCGKDGKGGHGGMGWHRKGDGNGSTSPDNSQDAQGSAEAPRTAS